jgi:hypothetical protein
MTEPLDSPPNDPEVNPYQSPRAFPDRPPFTCYKVDSRRLTYAEYWRFSPNPLVFLLAAGVKLLGVSVDLGFGFVCPLQLTRLPPEALSPHAAAALGPSVAEWQNQRMHREFYYTVAVVGNQESCAAVFLSEDGLVLAGAMYVRTTVGGGQTDEQTANSCLSKFRDGRFVGTTTAKMELNAPPQFDKARLPGRGIPDILAHHRDRLGQIAEAPIRFESSQVEHLVRELNEIEVAYYRSRGLLFPMTPDEIARAGPPHDLRQ